MDITLSLTDEEVTLLQAEFAARLAAEALVSDKRVPVFAAMVVELVRPAIDAAVTRQRRYKGEAIASDVGKLPPAGVDEVKAIIQKYAGSTSIGPLDVPPVK